MTRPSNDPRIHEMLIRESDHWYEHLVMQLRILGYQIDERDVRKLTLRDLLHMFVRRDVFPLDIETAVVRHSDETRSEAQEG